MSEYHQQFVIDCEYDAQSDQLLSMALTPLWPQNSMGHQLGTIAEPEREFYEVVDHRSDTLSDFVKTHVVPHLNQRAIPYEDFRNRLEAFMAEHKIEEVHADWVEDIEWLCRVMNKGNGERIKLRTSRVAMVFHPGLETLSEVPHNALHDARGMSALVRLRLFGLEQPN